MFLATNYQSHPRGAVMEYGREDELKRNDSAASFTHGTVVGAINLLLLLLFHITQIAYSFTL